MSKHYRIDTEHEKLDFFTTKKVNYIYFVNACIGTDPRLSDLTMEITDEAIYYSFESARKGYLMVFDLIDNLLTFANYSMADYRKSGKKELEKCTLESYHGALERLLKKSGAHATYASMV